MKRNKIIKVIFNLIDLLTLCIPLVLLIIEYVKYASGNYIEVSVTQALNETFSIQKNISVKLNVNISSLDLGKCSSNSYVEYKSVKNKIARLSVQIWLSIIASLSVGIFNVFFKPKFDDETSSRWKKYFKKFIYFLTKISIKIYIFPGLELFNIITFDDCIIIDEKWLYRLDDDVVSIRNVDLLNLIFFISFGFFFVMVPIMLCLLPIFYGMLEHKENWDRKKIRKLVFIFTYYLSTSTYFILSAIIYVESFYSKYLAPGSFAINMINEIFYTITNSCENCCCS